MALHLNMEKKRLFLLDAFALIYRAYFAFSKNPRINSKGENTSAVFGFTNTLQDLLRKENPTHIAVVFDVAAPTVRHEVFSDYKANREAMPEDIKWAIPWIHKIIAAFNIPSIGVAGYEADDVIGTLAKKAEQEGFQTFMMTPDKDYAQLVSENIFMYKPARFGKDVEILGIPEVQAKFEVERPEQVIDILGMWGDAVDNIPGIPGVGEKTAKKFIKQYGSLENLLENTQDLKGKMKENVENFKEQAILSKHLATIILDVPTDFDEASLLREEINADALREIFATLEFRNMADRILGADKIQHQEITPAKKKTASDGSFQTDLFGDAAPEESQLVTDSVNTIQTQGHNYQLINSKGKLALLLAKLAKATNISVKACLDNENSHLANLLGIAFTCESSQGYYVALSQESGLQLSDLSSAFKLEKTWIGHDLKSLLIQLAKEDITLAGKLFDTEIAHYLINPEMGHQTDALGASYLKYEAIPEESVLGKKGKNQKNWKDVDDNLKTDFFGEYAAITFQLKQAFERELKGSDSMDLFEKVEMPLVGVLARMEKCGIMVDKKNLDDYSISLKTELDALDKSIQAHAGMEFNVASPKQLGEVLFEKMVITDKAKKTKTGQYSTNEDTLVKLLDKHPVIQEILDFRQLNKLKSTYVDALPLLIHDDTKRIHTTYSQAVAATGRLSSNNPNLQNIPIRSEKGREVRKAFIAKDENHVLLAADYSQVELRIIAALSNEENMIEAFVQKVDIHSATAAKVFGVTLEEVTREMRSKAKAVNFGIIYGQGAFSLAQQLNIKRGEAKEIIDNYWSKYPKLSQYMSHQLELAREHGYVETIMGRRRYLKDINSNNAIVRSFAERNAINAPVQGSAADVIKLAMIKVDDAIKKHSLSTTMLLQVHDELVFEVPKNELEKVKPIIKEAMESAASLSVPLEVEMDFGDNWLEAH
jgi:DNA polymerase-1